MSTTNPKRPFCINTRDAKKTRMKGKKTRSRRELLKMVDFDKTQRSYLNFTDRIKSKATFTYYDSSLDYFLHNCKIDSYDDLCGLQSDAIQEKLQDFCRHLKNTTHPNSISPIMAGVFKFLHANGVKFDKENITSMYPAKKKPSNEEGYTLDQVQKLVGYWKSKSSRNMAVIMLLGVSGVREGAIPTLKFRDFKEHEDTYLIIPYRGEKEEYVTFCTPECKMIIDAYIADKVKRGEPTTPNSFVFTNYNTNDPFSESNIRSLLQWTLDKLPEIERTKDEESGRFNIAFVHGLRKFCDTQFEEAGIKDSKIQKLIGHLNGLTSIYYDAKSPKLYEAYKQAIPLLTILPENRQKRLISKLQEGSTEQEIEQQKTIETMSQKITFLEEKIKDMNDNPHKTYTEKEEKMLTLSESTLAEMIQAEVKKALEHTKTKSKSVTSIMPPIGTLFKQLQG